MLGGPFGLDASVSERADTRLSLGPITLPHSSRGWCCWSSSSAPTRSWAASHTITEGWRCQRPKVIERFGLRLGLEPAGPVFATARHEVMRFLRRLAFLIAARDGARAWRGAAAFVVFEDVSYWRGLLWSLDTVATVGSIPHSEPSAARSPRSS